MDLTTEYIDSMFGGITSECKALMFRLGDHLTSESKYLFWIGCLVNSLGILKIYIKR